MREIPLTQGKVAIVDDEDYDLVSPFKWCAVETSGLWYAARSAPAGRQRKTVKMRRLILDMPGDKQVDHINGNGLDNRKENLRLATYAQNNRNRRLRSDNTSGYKGVYRHRRKWRATIHVDGKAVRLGFFATKEDAARAYDVAAPLLHGEFARVNFPKESELIRGVLKRIQAATP